MGSLTMLIPTDVEWREAFRSPEIASFLSLLMRIPTDRMHTVVNTLFSFPIGGGEEGGKQSLQTPLLVSCRLGRSDCLRVLIECGASLCLPESFPSSATPMYVAAQNGHSPIIRELIKAGASVHTPIGSSGCTPLFAAAQKGHVEVIRELLAAGANVCVCNANGASALFIAAQNGHLSAVHSLIAAGANVDTPKNDGSTPLYVAAFNGHWEIVRALLSAGARPSTSTTKQGFNPLCAAAFYGHVQVIRELIAYGASVHTANKTGATPLFLAAQTGQVEAVQSLVAAGANVDAADYEGKTPLWIACHTGHDQVVQELLAARADPWRFTGHCPTLPLHEATRGGFSAVVAHLLACCPTGQCDLITSEPDAPPTAFRGRCWVDVPVSSSERKTALMIANEMHHEQVLLLLIAAGANCVPLPVCHWFAAHSFPCRTSLVEAERKIALAKLSLQECRYARFPSLVHLCQALISKLDLTNVDPPSPRSFSKRCFVQ